MILLFFCIIKISVSKDLITAGEQIEAKLNLKDSLNISISFNDSDLIEIYDVKIKRTKNGFDYLYKLSSYLPGEKEVYLLKDKDTIGVIDFKVRSLLKGDETDIVDIKNPLNVFNPFYLLFLLLMPVIAAIILFIKKPKRKKIIVEKTIPPEEEALNSLENTRSLIDEDIKLFFFRISEIFRIYIERKFGFPAIESTTTEIARYVKKNKINELNDFVELLREWDIYKFTEILPEKERALFSFEKIKGFVDVHR